MKTCWKREDDKPIWAACAAAPLCAAGATVGDYNLALARVVAADIVAAGLPAGGRQR